MAKKNAQPRKYRLDQFKEQLEEVGIASEDLIPFEIDKDEHILARFPGLDRDDDETFVDIVNSAMENNDARTAATEILNHAPDETGEEQLARAERAGYGPELILALWMQVRRDQQAELGKLKLRRS